MELFRIKELLNEFENYSFEDLARHVGVSRTNLYNYLSSSNQTINILQKVSKELRVDIRELFKSNNNEKEILGFLLMDDFIYYIKNEQDFIDVIDRFTESKSDKNKIDNNDNK